MESYVKNHFWIFFPEINVFFTWDLLLNVIFRIEFAQVTTVQNNI